MHCRRDEERQARAGLFSADRQLPGKDLCRRQNSRRFLQARRSSFGKGDVGFAADRPADPAALRAGLQERNPDHLHGLEPRSGKRPRHRGAGRRLGGADDLRHPVSRADRGGAGRLHRRRLCVEPDLGRIAALAARPRRRRHRRGRADGRIRGAGAVRGGHAGRGDVWSSRVPAGDRGDHRAGRDLRPRALGAAAALARARSGRGSPARDDRAGARGGLSRARQAGPQQPARRRQGSDHRIVRRRAAAQPGAQAVQGPGKGHRARRRVARRASDRRPRHPHGAADRGRGRHFATRARLGAVHPRRDPGARRGDARHRPGRAARRRARGRVSGKLYAALQFPALLDRRGRTHGLARPSRDRPRQARLASDPAVAAVEGQLPLHDPRRFRGHRIRTAPRRWPRCAAPPWR